MARVNIKDLPKDQKISKEEMKKVYGGTLARNSLAWNSLAYDGSSPFPWLNPLALVGVVTAAIILPLAKDDTDDDEPPEP